MRVRMLRVLAAAALAGAGTLAVAGPGSAGGPAPDEVFDEVGPHEFDVPADVCEITVEAFGAQGAGFAASTGGLGGSATATIVVAAGDPLQVNVGGEGQPSSGASGGAGGSNGGAPGGAGGFEGQGGGGGGGASDVRQGGTDLGNRVVVAGGGGGAAIAGSENHFGGSGGGINAGGGGGTTASDGGGQFLPGGGGGNGSTGNLFGGAGGTGGIGIGGSTAAGGGGGGGGWFGGGGGGGEQAALASGGGGGSGFTPDGTEMANGQREGDGLVNLLFQPCVDPPEGEFQPDATRETPRLGDGVYDDGSAAFQTSFDSVKPRFGTTLDVYVQNDGDTADDILLTGLASSPGFLVRYQQLVAPDGSKPKNYITEQVVGGGFLLENLSDREVKVRIRVKVSVNAPIGSQANLPLTATSVGDGSKADTARLVVTVVAP